MKLWRIFGQVQNKKTDCKFVLCPVCGNKTRTMIQENTEMKNFPLYCPECKKRNNHQCSGYENHACSQ